MQSCPAPKTALRGEAEQRLYRVSGGLPKQSCLALRIMGHVEVEVVLGSMDGVKKLKANALADTGATFSIIPEAMAKELSLTVTGEKVKVSTAKGYDELDLSHALMEIMGKRRIMPVLVSKSLDRVLVGVITLEAMQLRVNPVTEKLEEYVALLYEAHRMTR